MFGTFVVGTSGASPAPSPKAGGKPSKPGKTESSTGPGGSNGLGGSGSPAPTSAPAAPATTLELTAPVGASTGGYDKTALSAPADSPITINFSNADPGVPHNVEIFASDPATDSSAKKVFAPASDATITGTDTTSYDVGPLAAGTYYYHCYVHPTTMTGKLTVT
jgi:plastocyanin